MGGVGVSSQVLEAHNLCVQGVQHPDECACA